MGEDVSHWSNSDHLHTEDGDQEDSQEEEEEEEDSEEEWHRFF